MSQKIEVLYTCNLCETLKRPITVRARKVAQDIRDWTRYVAQQAGRDHRIESPKCKATTVDLYLPIGGTAQAPILGGVKNDTDANLLNVAREMGKLLNKEVN